MALEFFESQELTQILNEYKGKDQFMLYIKNLNNSDNYQNVTKIMYDYVVANKKQRCVPVNRVVEVDDQFASERKTKWGLSFLPKHIYIKDIVGESEALIACMGKYRAVMNEIYMLIPKKHIVNNDLPVTVLVNQFKTTAVTTTLKNGKTRESRVSQKEEKFVSIDFDKYDKLSAKRFEEGKGNGKYAVKLMDHQKDAIKFMVSSKKCILADGCGLGKTISTIVSALECDFKKILVICPASVKSTWKRELMTYEDEDNISIVKNKKWKESKWTIINYDILKNFYTLAEEIKYIDVNNVDENGRIKKERKIDWKVKPEYDEQGNLVDGTGIPKMKQSRNKDLIEKALKESQLYQSQFDLVIIDECHRLSNSSSQMCKIAQDLLKRLKPEGIFAISGTPMTNRPMNYYNILKLIGHPIVSNWEDYVKRYCDGVQIPLKGEWYKWLPVYERKTGKQWATMKPEEKDDFRAFLNQYGRVVWKTDGASNLDELRIFTQDCYIRRINTEIEGMVKKEVLVKDYDMSEKQEKEYYKVWDKYVKKCKELGVSVNDENKNLTEGIKLRQFLSNEMISKTIELAEDHIENGSKVLILCNYDEELYEIQKHFDKSKDLKCVIYNGKMSPTQKDAAEKAFMNDPDTKVFIGNLVSCGVGLTLTSANIAIFNSFSWLPSDNLQAEDRIFRLTQREDVKIYYQMFNDSCLTDMWEKVEEKKRIIGQTIVKRG